MSNTVFTKHIGHLRGLMPTLSLTGVILTYFASAAVGGYLLSLVITGGILANIIAFGVPIAIQFCRGIVAFFGQLNPDTPDYGYRREMIVGVLGAIAIAEVIGLSDLAGWQMPVVATVSILMAIGSIIEIMLLGEIKRHNRQEIMSDPEALQRIEANAIREADYLKFMSTIQAIKRGEGTAEQLSLTSSGEHAEIKRLSLLADQKARENEALRTAQAEAERQRMQDIEDAKMQVQAESVNRETQLKEQFKELLEQSEARASTRESKAATPTPPAKAASRPAVETDEQYRQRIEKSEGDFEPVLNGKRKSNFTFEFDPPGK